MRQSNRTLLLLDSTPNTKEMKCNMRFNTNQIMIGQYHCFGLCFWDTIREHNEDKYHKLTWKSFLQRNIRQKNRGTWFFDEWLLNKVRLCVRLFGYRLNYDIEVLMPNEKMPLLVRIIQTEECPPFYIMIAPRKYLLVTLQRGEATT